MMNHIKNVLARRDESVIALSHVEVPMRFALSIAASLVLAPLISAQDPKAPAPRRALFVHVGGYLYLNPLTSALPGGC